MSNSNEICVEGHWEFNEEFKYEFIKGKHCTIHLCPRPGYCDRGRWQTYLDVHDPQKLSVDSADGWDNPRYYFGEAIAKSEMESWLKARGEFIPKEIGRKIILTLAAQEYGLTVEDLIGRGYARENIEVEKPK